MKHSTLKNAQRLEARARKLWSLRLIDPHAPQYTLAATLWERAQTIRQSLTITNP